MRVIALVAAALAVLALVLAVAVSPTHAWQFGGGSLSWSRTSASSRTVAFEVVVNALCCPPHYLLIAGVNDRVLLDSVVDITDAQTPAGYRTYRSTGSHTFANSGTFTVSAIGGRIAALVNAADAGTTASPYTLSATLDLSSTQLASPAPASRAALAIAVPAGGLAAHQLDISAGQAYTCRAATLAESGVVAPAAFSVSSACAITWSTASQREGAAAVQIAVLFGSGQRVPIDVLFTVAAASGAVAPACAVVGGPATVDLQVGETASVRFDATGGQAPLTYTLLHAPAGASSTPASGADAATSATVTFTAGSQHRGQSYPVRVRFTSAQGLSGTCSASVRIAASALDRVLPAAVLGGASATVTVRGQNLGSGTDITSVTLAGRAVSVLSQTKDSVTVLSSAPSGFAAAGHVVVVSASRGTTTGLHFEFQASAAAGGAPPCPAGHADGYWCTHDGTHDNHYYQCTDGDIQGWRACPVGETCGATGFHAAHQCVPIVA